MRRLVIALIVLVAGSGACGSDPEPGTALTEGSLRLLHSEKPELAPCGGWAFDLAVDFTGRLDGEVYRFFSTFAGGGPVIEFQGERPLDSPDLRVEGNTIHFEFCAPNTAWRGWSVEVWLSRPDGGDTNRVTGGFGSPHYGAGP